MPRYLRKIIRVRAEDSPNVRLALAQQRAGLQPTGETVVPGVLSWAQYCNRRRLWSKIRQCIGLDAKFWEGAEELLFPPEWLNHSERMADELRGKHRRARAIGIDTGQGTAKTVWTACDMLGIIEQISKVTPDTSVIPGETIAFGRKHNVQAEHWVFDRGGGGREHADRLRKQGYRCRTVPFGGAVATEPRNTSILLEERKELEEERYAYKNRRAQMYGEFSMLLDPYSGPGFAISVELTDLRQQLDPIPRRTDGEGRLVLPPKNRKSENSTEETMIDIIGHSPDEADSLVLAVHDMLHPLTRGVIGAVRT